MSAVDIVQIIIGALSLLATIAVSFVIYWFQRRHEKEIERLDEERRIEEIKNEVNIFLIENEAERDYLPWCVIASSVHRHEKHTRAIYTNFCRCSAEVQKEILSQAELTITPIEGSEWVDNAINKLKEDIVKYKLATHWDAFLHDGAKYFHRGFTYFRDKPYDEYEQDKYSIPPIYKMRPLFSGDTDKINFRLYIEQYFDYILGDHDNLSKSNSAPIPPVDLIWDLKNLSGTVEEKDVCFWVIYYVLYITVNIYNRFKDIDNYFIRENSTDAEVETFEDQYYEALLWLYATYIYQPSKERKE